MRLKTETPLSYQYLLGFSLRLPSAVTNLLISGVSYLIATVETHVHRYSGA